ncbi:MAG TPA: hypothetical protein ENI31_07390 [Candidatus Omnitrophica bacterium]|nr:MAG: hypothetical protein DRP61_01355 [Candidatus Omnitrophota bacterium]RKY34187.1 MAG: hypothetical protein DRP69_05360 [Candidatus Omnitrophota bacterium]RKY43843.1 MAG: hypothetical protein DRP80_04065 [Candidatus Omnitrophota bacterium]HEC70088.1 hypothetical protein [Candidatus Omnitrophota bacterium]
MRPIRKQRVVLSMPGYRIEGYISLPEGVRCSDFLNSERNSFVSLTEVKIYDWQGNFLEDKDFIAANKKRISWVSEL